MRPCLLCEGYAPSNCPMCHGDGQIEDATIMEQDVKIVLPYSYKGIDNQTYQIIGRNRNVLQTKTPDGKIWFLTRKGYGTVAYVFATEIGKHS